MNTTQDVTPSAGEGVQCRPVVWMDVAKFFVLNYGLHAFTIVSRPGAGALTTMLAGLTAILIPFSGTRSAIAKLARFSILKHTKLAMATDAGALCMVVPISTDFGVIISPSLTNVHGHQPVHGPSLLNSIKEQIGFLWPIRSSAEEKPQLQPSGDVAYSSKYKLVRVPMDFDVQSLSITCCGKQCQVDLACNYSVLKTSAAIIQILYGSYELWAAAVRSDQLDRLGYAAYSITVIPYVIMSFLNGLASLSGPTYPSMYLVKYNGYYGADEDGKILQEPRGLLEERGSTHRTRSTPEQMISHEDFTATQGGSSISPNEPRPAILQSATACNEKTTNPSAARPIQPTFKQRRRDRARARRRVAKEQTAEEVKLIQDVNPIVFGAVGSTHGIPAKPKLLRKRQFIVMPLIYLSLAAPYIIIYLLTRFRAGQSTRAQRTWIICSIVMNQFLWIAAFSKPIRNIALPQPMITRVPENGGSLKVRLMAWLDKPSHSLIGLFIYTAIVSTPTIGSFVIVCQMMLHDRICVKV